MSPRLECRLDFRRAHGVSDKSGIGIFFPHNPIDYDKTVAYASDAYALQNALSHTGCLVSGVS